MIRRIIEARAERRKRLDRLRRLHHVTFRRRRWVLVKAATRSAFYRYPRALIDSLQRRPVVRVEPAGTASLDGIEQHALAAAWLGHAGVLARLGEANVLVDPVLSNRIGFRVGRRTMGPRRLTQAPVAAEDLPRIDVLLITHAHFDHLDRPTLRRLASSHTVVVTARRTRRLVPRGFGAVVEIGPGQAMTVRGLRIVAIHSAHWGARRLVDWRRGHNSYLVQSPSGHLLFAGDTGFTDAFVDLGPIDLAVFGIGNYDPWEYMHATPEQAWSMFRGTGASRLLPVHHSTFQLSDEPVEEPMRRLLKAAEGHEERILRLDPGELWGVATRGLLPRASREPEG
jgi:L-ascorbate metabolism protein UlaG (beta-lactamase superfamily)